NLHMDYIIATSNLWANVFGLTGTKDLNIIKNFISSLEVPDYISNDEKISVTDDEEKKKQQEKNNQDLEYLLKTLPDPLKYKNIVINPQDFEKDDDTNFHIDFITATSNLRATNYGIQIADRHSTKGIAGKIIPALATTTTVVA